MGRGPGVGPAFFGPSTTGSSVCSPPRTRFRRGYRTGGPDKWLAAAPASHFFCAFWGFLEEQFMSTAPTSTNPPLVCWSCHERTLGTHFCASCGKLLQLPQAVDYFALFGMPRKLWIEMSGLE